MSRWIYGWILSALGFFVVLIPACNQFSKVAEEGREKAREVSNNIVDAVKGSQLFAPSSTSATSTGATPGRVLLERNSAEIVLGTFNIQKFGVSKMSNPAVMGVLVDVARQFDVLAIQEIQSKNDQTFMQQYVDMINANGSAYSYILSPILGSKRYSEQYAFVYDTNRIELLDEGAVVPDPHDLLNREPMFSRFRTRTTIPSQGFTFSLANVHVAPNETRNEMSTLYEVFLWLQSYLQQYEDDIILMGDFNEPPRRYGLLWQIETLSMVLSEHTTTNTLRTKSYDNILFDNSKTLEFTGKAGVLDIQSAFGLTLDQANDVSDHLPVWAAFSAVELVPTQFARQPTGVK